MCAQHISSICHLPSSAAVDRVLDALHKNISQPGVFTPADIHHFEFLLEDAIDKFQRDHERTYLGRSKVRRLANRQK